MSEKQYTWYKIADDEKELFFGSNDLLQMEVHGKKVCIARTKDKLFGCANKCPHAGGYLADGYIDAAGNIVCPLHRYKFSLQNGRNTSGEGYYLKTYPVEIRNEGVFIGMEKTGFFG
jgi:3-phenylpropionate/trans-cinnamate dioxygenase ferredoxin subunit